MSMHAQVCIWVILAQKSYFYDGRSNVPRWCVCVPSMPSLTRPVLKASLVFDIVDLYRFVYNKAAAFIGER